MFFNKKILTGVAVPSLGSIGAFGSQFHNPEYRIMVNYNGQADLLLSLQIPPDYYPYQFKKTTLYDYLTEADKYIVVNDKVSEEKKKIKGGLQKRLNELLGQVKEFGPSLWNADLYDTGLVFRNDQFWNNKRTSILFLEQFIADDYTDIRDSLDLLPAHKKLIVTNYRAARDPYTIFSEKIFNCFENGAKQANGKNECTGDDKTLYEKFKEYMDEYNQEDINSIYRFGKYIEFWNDLIEKNKDQLNTLKFFDWIKKDNTSGLFSLDDSDDPKLSEKYEKTIFSKSELEEIKKWQQNWKINYRNNSDPKRAHHPALEQQILPGTAPLAEGSQKDVIVFLYQFAALIDKYTKGSDFETEFKDDPRKEFMKKALDNAGEMSKNIKDRIKNIRDYFKAINVVDSSFDPESSAFTTTNSKSFAVVTYPPSSFGAGEATVQSMSKFPFIYYDIGLKQVVPSNLRTAGISKVHDDHDEETLEHEIFSVDDNGWWWKIGNANLDPTNLLTFKGTADTMLLLANEDDWNLLNDTNSGTLKAISALMKVNSDWKEGQTIEINKVNKGKYPVSYNKYHLWNEGLRSPIALNLLLDNLVDIFQRQYDEDFKNGSGEKYKKAMDWGDYWSKHFTSGTSVNGAAVGK